MMTQTVRVELGPRSYEVRVGPGTLGQLGALAGELGGVSRCAVVSDDTVAGLLGGKALESLRSAGYEADACRPCHLAHARRGAAHGDRDRRRLDDGAVSRGAGAGGQRADGAGGFAGAACHWSGGTTTARSG